MLGAQRQKERKVMNIRRWIGSAALLAAVLGTGVGVAGWKKASQESAAKASATMPEPMEAVSAALAGKRTHVEKTTAIGTVIALRSVTVRTELPGTVRETALVPGRVVEAGTVLVRLDVSVEEAELKAQEAQASLAEATLARVERAARSRAASDLELDRARAERDVAVAQVARTRAVIDRKTIRAQFRSRVGLADVHPGQYLSEGTLLTTLQSVEDGAHVDFSVSQDVAAGLRSGGVVEILASGQASPVLAQVVAVDAKVDPITRNAKVRARVESASSAPGTSVRVRVPVGAAADAVAVPASALRKGPEGDHVFVIESDKDGKPRAHLRRVRSGALLGDEVLIHAGLKSGEQVATSGSFKLREGVLVAVAAESVKLAGIAR
jgi:membrane fusion protein (multidrug efflux system)